MMGNRIRRWFLGLLALLVGTAAVSACPFCGGQGQTLTGEVKEASLVLFGTLTNAKLDPNSDFGGGTTDLKVEIVLKPHEIVGDKKVITIPRYLPTDKEGGKFLIFCGVFNNKIDPYRGVSVKTDSDVVKYLQGALALKDKPAGDRLRFAFDFLDNADLEVANDAYKEFANADYRDYRDMAKNLPAEKIVKWLEDPETPTFRFGLYGSLLGHCGKEQHAKILRALLDNQRKRLTSGLDGLMAGYAMIEPKAGWEYVCDVLKDPKKDFMFRYAALRTARFFWEYRTDLVSKEDVVKGVCLLLDQGDIADLAVEDLRKWGRWEVADKVLALGELKSHDVPIVRRSVLRYALSCQVGHPRAAAYVADQRQKNPDTVKDAEELLSLEKKTVPETPVKN